MSNKSFTITTEGWWDSSGCDCCAADYFEFYNIQDEKITITRSNFGNNLIYIV